MPIPGAAWPWATFGVNLVGGLLMVRIGIDRALAAARARWLDEEDNRSAGFARLASFGDDYEILFTAPASRRSRNSRCALASKARRSAP